MPNDLVKSFAKKSGKSVEDIEDMWTSIKKSVQKQGLTGDSLYSMVVGILKKNLKLK